ncbi:MAG: DUF87 domain-containing protein [Acidobacteriota bacterium]
MSSPVDAYEKLGAFYLGRSLDPASGDVSDAPLLYDSKDLTTHAVCLGMTGSGKTGLGVTLLEEAAIDGVPAIVIDPKGDLGNLQLTFPELRGEDFAPWVDPGQASRAGQTPDEYAAAQAALWTKGLAKWDQDGDRIRRLREAAEVTIYTPGSDAGRPISVLSSFSAPPPEVLDDRDAYQDRLSTTASSLLGLLGVDADPVQSREAILLANVLDHAWRQGEDLDLAGLIQAIQAPPFEQVGVMPLEAFFPSKDRFSLAMALNNLLASPSFQGWMQGEALDIDRLLYTADGKPRVSILSIAHLSDAERMFFVALLLDQVLGWMRTRSGTSALRAILYMDEIYGYLPPIGNPPSKKPLLTLLKQARAFGLGLVLATQNPVDLDYKALSNIGTWLVGRLQAERDKARLMDGLLSTDAGLGKAELERLLSGLDKRVFLLHNVHEDAPTLFRVRWAMSYLRGPMTRREIRQLTPDTPDAVPDPSAASSAASAPRAAAAVDDGPGGDRPIVPSSVSERFLPLASGGGGDLLYRPHLVGAARVHFVDRRKGLEAQEEVVFLATIEDGEVDWHDAHMLDHLVDDDLEKAPEDDAGFASLPGAAGNAKAYRGFEKDFADMLYRSRRWELWKSSSLDLTSEPGESERDFRIRLGDAAREQRDTKVEALRGKYATKFTRLQDRIRRAEQKVEKEEEQAARLRKKAWLDVGATVLGAFMGRKTSRKASTAIRGFGRSADEARDVDRAEENLQALHEQFQDLERELQDAIDELHDRFDPHGEDLETIALKPRRTDVDVRLVALGWAPFRVDDGVAEPAW